MAKGGRWFGCLLSEVRACETPKLCEQPSGRVVNEKFPYAICVGCCSFLTCMYAPYHTLYSHHGAFTPGVTPETVDGMSHAKIHQLIDEVRQERYRWTPVRRLSITKRNGKQRPLGLPTWKDKLLQDVRRSILEASYEPQFRPSSQGFRPQRGCHTALQTIQTTWKGTRWFIEGDLASSFDTIDHEVFLRTLAEQLHDNRFLYGRADQDALHEVEVGTPVGDICRTLGVSEQTFYRWKKQCAGMGVAELRRLTQREEEHRKLKQLVADMPLDKHMLQEAMRKK